MTMTSFDCHGQNKIYIDRSIRNKQTSNSCSTMQKWKETLCIINLEERTQKERERERERLTLKMRFLFVASHAKPPLKCMFQTKTRTKAAIASVCATNVNGIAGTLNAISFLFFFPLPSSFISFLKTSQLYNIYTYGKPFFYMILSLFYLGIVSSKLSTSLCRAIWTVGLRSWNNLWWMPRWLLSIGSFFD